MGNGVTSLKPICATFYNRWHSYKATRFKGLYGAKMKACEPFTTPE